MRLYEVVTSTPTAVDRESGTIKGVRILGPVSANGREYKHSAIRDACPMYEGRAVNFDHPPAKGNQVRPIGDRAGWLENVKVDSDGGLSGDLRLLKSDSRADKVMEAAEQKPDLFGLSHNATGTVTRRGKTEVVEKILDVHSVDVVSDPATTRSLFESLEKKMKKTVREVAEGLMGKEPLAAVLCKLLEIDGMAAAADTPIDVPTDGSSDDAIKTAFEGAIVAAFRDDNLDTKATLQKIKDILKAYEKLAGGDTKASDPPAADAAPTTESLIQITASLKEQKALLEKLLDRPVTKPRSTPLRESGGGDEEFKPPKDSKEFAKRLRR